MSNPENIKGNRRGCGKRDKASQRNKTEPNGIFIHNIIYCCYRIYMVFKSHLLSTNGYPRFQWPSCWLASLICSSFKRVQRSKPQNREFTWVLKWSLPIPWIYVHVKYIHYTNFYKLSYSICRRRSQGIWNHVVTSKKAVLGSCTSQQNRHRQCCPRPLGLQTSGKRHRLEPSLIRHGQKQPTCWSVNSKHCVFDKSI